MAGNYLIQHEIQGVSNLPEDRYVNTFHVNHFVAGGAAPELDQWANNVRDFYNGVVDQVNPLIDWMNSTLSDAPYRIKIYELANPKPRPIVYETEGTMTGGASAGDSLPHEVAMCLSYRAVPAAGQPIARYRGRLYLGPMGSQATGVDGRPNPQLGDDMLTAARRLWANLGASGAEWIVYSPRRNGDDGGQTDGQIVEFSVDDAWDTQRRRGLAPTERTRVPAGV